MGGGLVLFVVGSPALGKWEGVVGPCFWLEIYFYTFETYRLPTYTSEIFRFRDLRLRHEVSCPIGKTWENLSNPLKVTEND